jgi:glycosyltransferase involved in cell wall biosynthesis
VKVAALVPYHAAFCSGQRFRVELWARRLAERGIDFEFLPFTSSRLTDVLYEPGRHGRKAYRLLRCYGDQLGRVLRASRPDVTYLYREAALVGPPLLERLARGWGAPVVYDIDEPLFVPYVSPRNSRFNFLRCIGKFDELFRMSDHVLAVDQAIADYASRLAPRVSVVPMAVDTEKYSPVTGPRRGRPTLIGWVGAWTTQTNLAVIAEPLRRLGADRGAALRVVADEPMTMPGVALEFIPWSVDREVPALQECAVGVVPVREDAWSPWKFFFKLIQMMSLGMAVVATPVGSNLEVIEDGVNGFLAATEGDWYDRLRALIDDEDLRLRVGRAARQTVLDRFDLRGQIDTLEAIFRDPTGGESYLGAGEGRRESLACGG